MWSFEMNAARKLIESHLVSGEMTPGSEIALRIDQTLAQDATGTLVMLEFEALGIPRVKTDLSVQYVDHNLLQVDWRNADDHLFLESACRKFGVWYSKPGNGVSHPVHQARFGVPGHSLLGSDSHTCAAGAIGMLAFGAGGLEVAMAMAGEPFHLKMPKVFGVRLAGSLPEWVSAKDVILEMLRRHGVSGGVGKVIEYHGSGLANLTAWDRHVIANMGAELGATATVFPSDGEVRRFMASEGRESEWTELLSDSDAAYDEVDEIDLGTLEPLIALPSSPGKVVPVSEVAGRDVYQCVIGSSANPGLRDFAIAAEIVRGKQTHQRVSFDVNPTSRQILEQLIEGSWLGALVSAGARVHQAGCMGCIGMGQAPATKENSLRTMPRNFPGRSGVADDQVYLCSPETAAASALQGVITDPRTLDMEYPKLELPARAKVNTAMLVAPVEGTSVELRKGPNVVTLPDLDALPEGLEGPVLIVAPDDVSTDEILPAGSKIMAFRSNIPEISQFVFTQLDESFHDRAIEAREKFGCGFVVGGRNYGQGSSREHAALAPRYLGVRAVLADSFARIHWQNLINFGIVPLTFEQPDRRQGISQDDLLVMPKLRTEIEQGSSVTVENRSGGGSFTMRHDMSARQVDVVLKGGLLNVFKHG
jgi:predicted aconitate hydratase